MSKEAKTVEEAIARLNKLPGRFGFANAHAESAALFREALLIAGLEDLLEAWREADRRTMLKYHPELCEGDGYMRSTSKPHV